MSLFLREHFRITALVWLCFREIPEPGPLTSFLRDLARPQSEGGWLIPASLWLAVALTVISGTNYLWSGRKLLRGAS